jgi:MCRA family
LLPYSTSQFLGRAEGDRPAVVPPGSKNFALLGQFVEIPDCIVYTTEYSVRGAIHAVKKLVQANRAAFGQRGFNLAERIAHIVISLDHQAHDIERFGRNWQAKKPILSEGGLFFSLELIGSGRLQFHDKIGWLRRCGNSIACHLRRMTRGRINEWQVTHNSLSSPNVRKVSGNYQAF